MGGIAEGAMWISLAALSGMAGNAAYDAVKVILTSACRRSAPTISPDAMLGVARVAIQAHVQLRLGREIDTSPLVAVCPAICQPNGEWLVALRHPGLANDRLAYLVEVSFDGGAEAGLHTRVRLESVRMVRFMMSQSSGRARKPGRRYRRHRHGR
jgi:hypothetical protein